MKNFRVTLVKELTLNWAFFYNLIFNHNIITFWDEFGFIFFFGDSPSFYGVTMAYSTTCI